VDLRIPVEVCGVKSSCSYGEASSFMDLWVISKTL